jgi:hypothetical protein
MSMVDLLRPWFDDIEVLARLVTAITTLKGEPALKEGTLLSYLYRLSLQTPEATTPIPV